MSIVDAFVISFRFLWNNKGKALLILAMAIVFVVLLFPLGDLNDFITAQIAKTSPVYFQFDNMHLNPITVRVTMDGVTLDTPQLSEVTAESVSFSPGFALLWGSPSGSAEANGIFKGNVDISVSPSKGKTKLEAHATKLSLKEIRESAGLPVAITGDLNLNSQVYVDTDFKEQPEGDATVIINKFEMPSGSISTQQMGSVALPQISFDKVELKGKLSNGKFQIESGKIGSSKNDFYGDVKGELAVTIKKVEHKFKDKDGKEIVDYSYPATFGEYSMQIDLKANADFIQRASLFMGILDSYKVPGTSNPTEYKLSIKAENLQGSGLQMAPIR